MDPLRIDQKCQIRIRIETNADPQHCIHHTNLQLLYRLFQKKGIFFSDPDPLKWFIQIQIRNVCC